jgi:hypothetical protein
MDLVHGLWTMGEVVSRWTKNRGGGNGSPDLLLLAYMGHDGSLRYGGNGEVDAT